MGKKKNIFKNIEIKPESKGIINWGFKKAHKKVRL
jgi:hypothetical protein